MHVETDKVTYSHFDSYPNGLGRMVVEAIRRWDDEQLAGAAVRIELVSEDAAPTPDQVERYAAFADLRVSSRRPDEWYVLLRDAQGQLDPYVDGTLDHMIDSSGFLADSLFCEWAYIINMDTRELEVYGGFQTTPGEGRYVGEGRPARSGGETYYGVGLLTVKPLDEIRALSAERLAHWIDHLKRSAA